MLTSIGESVESVSKKKCKAKVGRICRNGRLQKRKFIYCYKEILVTPKIGYFSPELCPNLWTEKISPRQVGCVVNRTCMLTAPATIDASWLDAHSLLHVGRL